MPQWLVQRQLLLRLDGHLVQIGHFKTKGSPWDHHHTMGSPSSASSTRLPGSNSRDSSNAGFTWSHSAGMDQGKTWNQIAQNVPYRIAWNLQRFPKTTAGQIRKSTQHVKPWNLMKLERMAASLATGLDQDDAFNTGYFMWETSCCHSEGHSLVQWHP